MLLRIAITVDIGWAEVKAEWERQEIITKYLWGFPINGHVEGRKGFAKIILISILGKQVVMQVCGRN
jgi:hypothetical protein